MYRRLPDERRTTADAERISGATGRPRILCDVLDEMPDVDSRAGRSGREFLDEDGVPRAGYAARQHEPGGSESRQSKDHSDRAISRAIVSHLSRWKFENSCRTKCYPARDCV